MCDTCGCDLQRSGEKGSEVIAVHQSLLAANSEMAEKNRAHFRASGTVAINIISSPGSGKTTLLEKTIERLGAKVRIGVIEGDIESIHGHGLQTRRESQGRDMKRIPLGRGIMALELEEHDVVAGTVDHGAVEGDRHARRGAGSPENRIRGRRIRGVSRIDHPRRQPAIAGQP